MYILLHVKKVSDFPASSARMSLAKLFLAGNNLNIPDQGEFSYSDIPAGDRKIGNFFYSVLNNFPLFPRIE
jgi:hypothetical protein